MKYLVVGLLMIAGLAGQPTAAPPAPLRRYASAGFTVSAAGVETKIEVYVNQTAASPRVGLSIQRTTRACARDLCHDVPLISGYSYRDVSPNDALIDRSLTRASVHATILFHDDVAAADIPVRLDVVWTATGPLQCPALFDEKGCQRAATVLGEVASGPLRLIPGQAGLDGRIEWIRPPTTTYGP